MTYRRLAFLTVAGLGLTLGLLVGFALLATDKGVNTRQYQSQLQCKSLAQCCEAYQMNPESGKQYPENLRQLLVPPFGGSFLRNGEDDLKDPWGQPYHLTFVTGPDGTKLPLVYTTTPDGTTVSQYGAGPMSRVE